MCDELMYFDWMSIEQCSFYEMSLSKMSFQQKSVAPNGEIFFFHTGQAIEQMSNLDNNPI